METLVNRTTGGDPSPGPTPCRGVMLALDRKAAQPHMARIDAAGRPRSHDSPAASDHPERAYDWQWVALASLIPLLGHSGGGLPSPFTFRTGEETPALLPDLIVCVDDDTLGLTGRLALLRLVREYLPEVPFLLLVREIAPEDAVEALRAGATDLLARRDWASLPLLVERALRRASRVASAHATHHARREARLAREREGEMRRLRASEEKYRALFEHVPEPLAVVQSATGTLLLANRALLALLGQEPPPDPGAPFPLSGRHLSVLFPTEAEAEADLFLQRLREENGEISGRYFLRQPAGTAPRPVDLRAAPIPWGAAGASGAVAVAFQDAALREESGAGAALAYFALDRLGEGRAAPGTAGGGGEWVLWTDSGGHLLHANRPLCEALARPLVRLRGRHLGEIAPSFGPGAWTLHRGEARAYGAFQIETFFHTADGTPLRAEATAHALTLGGREYHCFIGRSAPASAPA